MGQAKLRRAAAGTPADLASRTAARLLACRVEDIAFRPDISCLADLGSARMVPLLCAWRDRSVPANGVVISVNTAMAADALSAELPQLPRSDPKCSRVRDQPAAGRHAQAGLRAGIQSRLTSGAVMARTDRTGRGSG